MPDKPDDAPDALRRDSSADGGNRGAVLADARTRQEHALAYRAKVDVAYARAAAVAGDREDGDREDGDREDGDRQDAAAPAKRPDVAEKYPDRYARSDDPLPSVERPGEHPGRWIGDIYPGRDRHERPNNCGECARAVDSTWHGSPAVAAELANRRVGGERPSVMSEWAGRSPEPASMGEIGRRLRELGPGSSAVVGFDRADAPGHWFNAVNHQGKILAVDGQAARFENWPPSKDGLGFDEKEMSGSDAIYFTADGKVVKNDHQ